MISKLNPPSLFFRMLAGSRTDLLENEEIQRQEKEFFERLAEPPKTADGLKYLLEKHKAGVIDEEVTAGGAEDGGKERALSDGNDDMAKDKPSGRRASKRAKIE